jgi:beta-N-acetylhexosaminidase
VSDFLVCGVAGTALDRAERRLLDDLRPAGIILFARNVVDREQLVDLVGQLRDLPWAPYLAIDLEGGRVNRLERVVGPLPSAAQAAGAGAHGVRALAEAAAAACAYFGIGADLAPVADVARAGGFLASEGRCLGSSPEEVRHGAAAFLDGLAAFGVAGCLKHYPGLGSGRVDSHRDLPTLGESVGTDMEVFHALLHRGCAVMVAHALAPTLAEGRRPATLSPAVVERLRGHATLILADDLEMGALAAFGTIGERAVAALAAGCDQVLVCNALAARRAVVEAIDARTRHDPAFANALEGVTERVRGFGRGRLRETSWDEVVDLCERVRRSVEYER